MHRRNTVGSGDVLVQWLLEQLGHRDDRIFPRVLANIVKAAVRQAPSMEKFLLQRKGWFQDEWSGTFACEEERAVTWLTRSAEALFNR